MELKNDDVAATDQQQSGNKKRKKAKEVAIFGNYRNYYTYRVNPN